MLVVRALKHLPGFHGEQADERDAYRGVLSASGRDLLLVEAGLAPENFTGVLRRFAPDAVLLIDAAQMGMAAGAVDCVNWQDSEGYGASTHTLPPSTIADFLVREMGCRVSIIGIQPQSLEFDQPVSSAVLMAVDQVVRELTRML